MKKLPLEFYLSDNVLEIAKKLLGKILYTNINGVITSGQIVETEAYMGILDKASHAYNNRRTKRTEVMFSKGGLSYVYICYGMHFLLNVVTNIENIPDAVLIRALKPLQSIKIMKKRSNKNENFCSGPALLSKSMGIDKSFNNVSFLSQRIWIEDNKDVDLKDIEASPRVGIDYAEEFRLKPWRFSIKPEKIKTI
ncbi:MAG: hypothetical protein A3F40_03100 [Chlamydiae bacterium RIFCSPHIGHO2_12_FULL_27_8]|nr:MAG: hypothetical protein A3F40_03100 [Chlamydiae bacterium RIFCSPHIGHO2_12_FULL_27_8]